MVAKSYQNDEILCKPYPIGDKKYVRIRRSSGLVKEVRWYDNYEYWKANPGWRKRWYEPQKEYFGFEKGFIYTYEGDEEFFIKHAAARFTKWWGWGSADLITDLPQGTKVYTLDWSSVGDEDGYINEAKAKNYKKERKILCSTIQHS